jgi:hypothetical protein
LERAARSLTAADRAHRADRLRLVHGALLVDLRNILETMEGVAALQPVRAQAPGHLLRTA